MKLSTKKSIKKSIKKTLKKTLKKNKNKNKTHTSTTLKKTHINNIYYIHDNGGRSFKVVINGETVKVHKHMYDDDFTSLGYEKKPSLTFNANKIFIGYSPKNKMTLFSGGFGPKNDGNSILLHIKNNDYVYIGSEIYSFTSISEIIKYVSPVGNSDVPYPYAIDKDNNVYLMIENVILSDKVLKKLNNDDKAGVHNSSIDITSDKFEPYNIYYDYYDYYNNLGHKIEYLPLKKKILQERL
jgi:hypothetical protein